MRKQSRVSIVILIGVVPAAWALYAAQVESLPVFEVASVRRTVPGSPLPAEWAQKTMTSRARIPIRDTGRVVGYHTPLRVYLQMAYELPEYRLSAPEWMDRETYDISAKMPASTSDDHVLLMLQSLLTERFKLKVHHEQRSMSGYALLVDKGGPKLKTSPENVPPVVKPTPRGLEVQARTLDGFAQVLTRFLGAPVFNMTGIEGLYDYKLSFASEASNTASPHPAMDFAGLPSSLRQVGLKVEDRKMAVDILIIEDGLKTPIEN